jgi:hypothetical protein
VFTGLVKTLLMFSEIVLRKKARKENALAEKKKLGIKWEGMRYFPPTTSMPVRSRYKFVP